MLPELPFPAAKRYACSEPLRTSSAATGVIVLRGIRPIHTPSAGLVPPRKRPASTSALSALTTRSGIGNKGMRCS